MDQFIVSALKNRPKSFEEVIGQDNVTYTLKNSLKTNQLPQAYFFLDQEELEKRLVHVF